MIFEHNDNAQWNIPHNSLLSFQLLIKILISDICFNPLRWFFLLYLSMKNILLEILANANASNSERHFSLEIYQTWDYFQCILSFLSYWGISD